MLVAFLSQGWMERLGASGGDLPSQPGVSACVQHVVTGIAVGEVRYFVSVVDGRIVEVGLGDAPDADLTYLVADAEAQQVARGELTVEVAFMQGRAKVVGDMGRFMGLMPLMTSDGYRAALSEVSSQTDY